MSRLTWELLKRDASWRWIPWLTLGSAIFCALWQWRASVGRSVPDFAARMIFMGAFAAVAYTAGYVVSAQQTDTGFQSTLPVTVRQIYLTRTVAIVALLWLPVLADAAVGAPVGTLANFVAVFTLIMAALQAAIIRGAAMPPTLAGGTVMVWMIATGATPIFPDWIELHLAQVICWPVFAVIFALTWRGLPESFPAPTLGTQPPARGDEAVRRNRTPAAALLTVWRTVFPWNGYMIPYMFAGTLFLGGSSLLMVSAWTVWLPVRPKIGWLYALPIAKGRLLAAVLLPSLVAMCAGYLLNVHRSSFANTVERGITVRASQSGFYGSWPDEVPDCKTQNIIPAPEFWVPVTKGRAPKIKAPWGETFQPATFRRGLFDVFNPYAVGCANSQRFFDWQFRRATLAIYGHQIPSARRDGDYGDRVVTNVRSQVAGTVLIVSGLLLGALVTMISDWRYFRRLQQPVRVALMLVAVASLFVSIPWQDQIPVWLLWALPASLSGTVAAGVLIVSTLCLSVYVLFGQLEFADKPASFRD